MTVPRGRLLSPNDTVLYESLASLLKDYRRWRKISQEKLAELIGVGVRELRNWEAARRRVSAENLHDIAEITGIPMQVCVALNANQPIWYSLRKRLFMYSSLEGAQFSSPEVFRHRETSEDEMLLKKAAISKDRHIDMILACHQDLYGTERQLPRSVIREAIRIVPRLNNIMFDSWNHYVGHQVCLPLTMEAYQSLKQQPAIEKYLTSGMIGDIELDGKGVFFFYSLYGASVSVSSRLVLDGARELLNVRNKGQYLIASHTITREAAAVQENAGMHFGGGYASAVPGLRASIYEIELAYYLRPQGPVGWIIEQFKEEASTRNSIREPLTDWVSPRSDNVTALSGVHGSEVVNQETRPREMNSRGSRGETCTNPQCSRHGQAFNGNIVANGTYAKKNGTVGRRFLCKACGKSFCSRTGTFFYDLRSPEEKVLVAMKLLAKGMPLKEAAKSLGVRIITIQHWLRRAAPDKCFEALLLSDQDISPSELVFFRNIVQPIKT